MVKMSGQFITALGEILNNYGASSDIAKNLDWAQTTSQYIDGEGQTSQESWALQSIHFNPGYIDNHAREAVVQMILTYISHMQGWNPDEWATISPGERESNLSCASDLYMPFVSDYNCPPKEMDYERLKKTMTGYGLPRESIIPFIEDLDGGEFCWCEGFPTVCWVGIKNDYVVFAVYDM